jgi:hypothetical protein
MSVQSNIQRELYPDEIPQVKSYISEKFKIPVENISIKD